MLKLIVLQVSIWLERLFKAVIYFLFPRVCLACKNSFVKNTFLCNNCLLAMENLKSYKVDFNLDKVYFDTIASLYNYHSISKEIMIDFKFNKNTYLIPYFKNMLDPILTDYSKRGYVLVIAPSSKTHYMLKDLAKLCRSKIVVVDCLRKKEFTKEQKLLKREDRLVNLQGSIVFKKLKNSNIKIEKTLLLDDIITTGATMNECSRVLKINGSKTIDCLSITNAKFT